MNLEHEAWFRAGSALNLIRKQEGKRPTEFVSAMDYDAPLPGSACGPTIQPGDENDITMETDQA
ncbi:hypothetical protein D3C78_1954330 [compost metagenome]